MMKRFTQIINNSTSLKVIAGVCLLFVMQAATAQGRVETFDEEVLITPVYNTNILGEENTSTTSDRITWDYIKDIKPGTGRWFTTSLSGDPLYKWVADGGQDGGGTLQLAYDGSGAHAIFYIFNNKGGFAGNFDFVANYFYGIAADKLGAISYFNIVEPDPADNGSVYWRTRNSGTGAFSDNGIIRFKGGNNAGRTFWNPDITGTDPGTWESYSGQQGVGGGDWIVVGFAFGKPAAVPDVSGLVKIDDVTLPFSDSVVDDIAPTFSITDAGMDSLGVWADEVGKMYVVPGGTGSTEAEIKAAMIGTDAIAVPITGSVIRTDALADGKYDVYVIDEAGNITGKNINIGADIYAPLVNGDVTSVFAGYDDVTATMDEVGTLKLVADGAGADAAAVVSVAASEKELTTLVIPETVADGQYDLYAIDEAGNASTPVDITVFPPDTQAPVFTNTGKQALIATDNIEFTTDDATLDVFVVPAGTTGDLMAIQDAALETVNLGSGTVGSISAINLAQGDYILYSTDRYGNLGTSGVTYNVLDVTGPIASSVSSGDLNIGFPITVTLNEDATVYVVPAGTDIANVETVAVISVSSSGTIQEVIETVGAGLNEDSSYDIYAKDERDNWSEKLGTITVKGEPENIYLLNAGEDLTLSVYPNPASDVINVQSDKYKISSMNLIDLGGRSILRSTRNFLKVDGIENGIYILRIHTHSGDELRRKVIVSN